MRNSFAKVFLAALLAASLGAVPAFAGGALEQIDLTANAPSPIPGHINAPLVRIFWDARCIPVRYLVNDTLDPIPNPLGTSFLSVADATTALQSAMSSWNGIRTSYIHQEIAGTVSNPGLRGFDMKNELTFRTAASFGAIASSPSTSLIRDTEFTHGLDVDGDGDSDVSSAISSCTDTDGDGDVEFPAGFYKAGTILDNDVQYNTKSPNGFRFTIDPAAADTVSASVDLECVSVHELGHSFGLSHVINNNKSASDGDGVTMFPFIDTNDPAAELQVRSISSDDAAWASYYYPEGSASSGPAAIQPGDIPFNFVYGLIKGSVTHGVFNEPVAGASVSATNLFTGELHSAGFSGTTRLSYNPATGGLFLIDPAYNVLNGDYVIPVPLGLWKVGIEAMDGGPVAAANVSLSGQIGDLFGQLNFNEELWNAGQESANEVRPGLAVPVASVPSLTTGNVNFTTNQQVNISNFGNRNFIGFTGSPGGRYYAVRFPASQITAVNPGGDVLIQAGAYETSLLDASTVPLFAEAMLTTGTVNGATATLDLAHPLARDTNFLAADNDFAPFYFPLPNVLGKVVRKGIEKGEIENLFLVLRLPPGPFPGASAAPPLIGLDGGVPVNDVPINGLSFISDDGVTFTQVTNFNFRFSLIVAPAL